MTRPDFDGVVCAVLIADVLAIEEPVYWIEPGDFKRGAADIQPGDIIANLPYDPRCDMWVDHHSTNRIDIPFKGLFRDAPSAARNVFTYFNNRFKHDYSELVYWADRIDSAGFTREEVLHPEKYDYVLLSMTVSGENRADEDYWNKLVRLLRTSGTLQVMADPEVAARCRRFIEENRAYAGWLKRYTRIQGPVAVTDFRSLGSLPSGNRFLSYCLFPDAAVSVRIRYEDPTRQSIVVNVGHSIFNRGCRVHVGDLLAAFGGGGHRAAASARFPAAKAESYLPQIIGALVKNRSEPARRPGS